MSTQPAPRPLLIAGNWKMNLGLSTGIKFLETLSTHAGARTALTNPRVNAALFVGAPFIAQLSAKAPSVISIGSQNVHWATSGAYTGEVSAAMLKEAGVSWTLAGHSERRQYFGETHATAARRAHAALKSGVRVILCIGETLAEREAGQTHAVLDAQLGAALPISPATTPSASDSAIDAEYWDGRLVIAYEPVWAIGTGVTATPEQAQEAHAYVRAKIAKVLGAESAQKTQILYGGSVTPENIDGLLAMPDIDGGLVGGASTDALRYAALLESAGRRANGT